MSTLYDLFKVKEDASIDEIKKSYDNILKIATSKPQTEKIVEQIRRVKIAYGILIDEEKRKKYDEDLANKRAEQLIQNVQTKSEEQVIEKNNDVQENIQENIQENKNNEQSAHSKINEENLRKVINAQIDHMIEKQNSSIKSNSLNENQQVAMSEKELRKEEKKKRKQIRKEEALKREMEIQAYGKYLSSQGYKVKYPWTWLRIKRLFISIIGVIIGLVILWNIPYVRKTLTELYNNNVIFRMMANLIISIFNAIVDGIKGIFK